MKSFALLLLIACWGISAQTSKNKKVTNRTDWLDTSIVSTTLDSAEIIYSDVFNLTNFEDCRIMLKVDDTSSAGFANDSIALILGYQTGSFTLNSSSTRDTSWDYEAALDTMLSANLGSKPRAATDSVGILYRSSGMIDTSSVSGYAIMQVWFIPEWNEVIRYFVEGYDGSNEKGSDLIIIIEQKRRHHIPVGK